MSTNTRQQAVRVTAGAYRIFGSGAASAALFIDGRRVTAPIDQGGNGFVGWKAADVPVAVLRAARTVEWHAAALPGRSRSYNGSGKGFLRYLTRQDDQRDPLTVPLAERPKAVALMRRRYDEAWAAARAAEAASGRFEFRPSWGGRKLERRERIAVRLPDGAAGWRWTEWEAVGYSQGFYPPRRLWPVGR